MRCEPISEEQVKRLCLKAREILIEEGNVQVVDSPVTVSLEYPTPNISRNQLNCLSFLPNVVPGGCLGNCVAPRYVETSMGNFSI